MKVKINFIDGLFIGNSGGNPGNGGLELIFLCLVMIFDELYTGIRLLMKRVPQRGKSSSNLCAASLCASQINIVVRYR